MSSSFPNRLSPPQSGLDSPHAPPPSKWRTALRGATNVWLGSLLLSGAAGCLVFVFLVIPWTIRGFGKAGLEVPGILGLLDNNRAWAGAGVIVVASVGIFALVAIRRRILGLLVYLAFAALLIALAASCILGWWMLYAAQLEELAAPM